MKGPVQFEPVLFYSSIGAARFGSDSYFTPSSSTSNISVAFGGMAPGAPRTVTQRGGNDQRSLAANFHGGHAFIPAGDDALLSNRKLERLVPVHRAVELLALLAVLIQPSRVMHHADLARFRRGAGANRSVDDLQT